MLKRFETFNRPESIYILFVVCPLVVVSKDRVEESSVSIHKIHPSGLFLLFLASALAFGIITFATSVFAAPIAFAIGLFVGLTVTLVIFAVDDVIYITVVALDELDQREISFHLITFGSLN